MVELISRWGFALGAVVGVGATSAPDDVQPLEVVAVDVSGYPQITIDVALPERELPGDVSTGAFEMPGATGVVAEALPSADLTVGIVLDASAGTPSDVILTQQGAITELVRNIPDDVELLMASPGGIIVGPTTDRAATLTAVGTLGTASVPPGSTVATAAIGAAAALASVPDGRHQLVLFSGPGPEITPAEAEQLMASLDTSMSALRVLTVGGQAGARLGALAAATGGFAVDVGTGHVGALRAVDVLTTTFADQYRVTATVAAPGDQLIRLTVAERSYETVLPDIGSSEMATTSTAATSTTTTPSTTSTTTPVPAAPQGPPSVDTVARTERSGRPPSMLAGAQAVFAVAAITAVIVAWRRRRRG